MKKLWQHVRPHEVEECDADPVLPTSAPYDIDLTERCGNCGDEIKQVDANEGPESLKVLFPLVKLDPPLVKGERIQTGSGELLRIKEIAHGMVTFEVRSKAHEERWFTLPPQVISDVAYRLTLTPGSQYTWVRLGRES